MLRIAWIALTLIFVAAWNSCAYGADWEFNPKVEGGYLYDDNYRLAPPGAEITVSGALADVALELRTLTPRVEFSVTPRARATYFPSDTEENSDDYFLVVNWKQRGQRANGAFRGDYAIEDVVSSEQPTTDIGTGLGEPDIAEGGRLIIRNRRELLGLQPSVSWQTAQRHELTFGARYVDVEYDFVIPGLQVGYIDAALTAAYAFDYSPRSSFITRVRASRYEIDIGENRSQAQGIELEWSRETTETTRAFVRVGAQRTELDELLVDPILGTASIATVDEMSWLAGAGVNWKGGLTEFFLDAMRTVGPNSSGFIVERDQLRLRLDRMIGPRFTFFLGARGTYDNAVNDLSVYQGRTYATGEIGFRWRMLQRLSLVASYDHTWQEFRDPNSDAKSSGALLTLLYEPHRRD
jgi:hypothetical protein